MECAALPPALQRSATPAPTVGITAGVMASQPPCRGRRPRRPGAAVSADPTVFRQPSPGCVIISQYITRHTGRFPPAVGVGVPDDPFLHPPPTPPRSANPLVGAGFHPRPAFVHHRRYGVAGAAGGGAARKGGTPGEGSPFTPSCASSAQESSARCGARPWAPPLDPARFFVKKRGKKLLLG